MEIIMENWKRFLREESNIVNSMIKDIKSWDLRSCYEINSRLTNGFTTEHRLNCLGIGTDKYVFQDSEKSGFVLKFEKQNPIKENSTMETVVWKYLQGTPFEDILAPIEKDSDGYYYMKLGTGGGDIREIENRLIEIASNNKFKFKDLEYYFLSDANSSNIRKIENTSVLIDYDDSWPWVFKNKEIINKIKDNSNGR